MIYDNKLKSVEALLSNQLLHYKSFDDWISKHINPAKSLAKLTDTQTTCLHVTNCTLQDNGYDCGLCMFLNILFICKRHLQSRDFIKNLLDLEVTNKCLVTMTPTVMVRFRFNIPHQLITGKIL